MTSHKEVAQAWSSGSKAEGSRMYTDGTTIFSYGSHFPIATELSDGTILFNTDRYSSSTSKHQGYVRNQCGDVIECTTSEIRQAVNYPNKPIILTKEVKPQDINGALEILKAVCKEKGMKIFPMKKLKTQIESKLFFDKL